MNGLSNAFRQVTLLVCGVSIAGLWLWSSRHPLGPSSGSQPPAPALSSGELTDSAPLRLAVWNIHGGKGLDGRRDLGRTAARLRGFDLVGLNEVQGGSLLPLAPFTQSDQASALGIALGVEGRFLPYETRYGRPHFGNGYLSRRRLDSWIVAPLPHSNTKGHGNVSMLALPAWGGLVEVVVTHIDHRRDRRQQLEFVTHLFRGLAAPCVLMGDLNTRADDPWLQPLLRDTSVVDCLRQSEGEPTTGPDRIDWIFARGLRVVRSATEVTDASDHPLLWAELVPIQAPVLTRNPPPSEATGS